MSSSIQEYFFTSRDEASKACANRLASSLSVQLAQNGSTSVVVTGGSSPAACYAELSGADLDWSQVTVVPSDERWLSADDDNSNEKLIREKLLVAAAEPADFVPLYKSGVSRQARCEELNTMLPAIPLPFAATLLGMGDDGHIASLFPDAANLNAGLNPASEQMCIAVDTSASTHPRLSLTIAALLQSKELVLLFFGNNKRDVYEAAKTGEQDYPVSALLSQDQSPVKVYWAA
ncbi:MAG: 6-phosphogluconolactonase [Woeseiaceae bacterium]